MTHVKQKAALTRAVNSGSYAKVLAACKDAVRVWNADGWPDDWSRWQRALDDASPHVLGPRLEDLADHVQELDGIRSVAGRI